MTGCKSVMTTEFHKEFAWGTTSDTVPPLGEFVRDHARRGIAKEFATWSDTCFAVESELVKLKQTATFW